jgi:predicted nucleic acid-binding protein
VLDILAYNIKTVFDSPIMDFEDALIEETAYQTKIEYIVTRNVNDFKNSRVKIITPKKLLMEMKNMKKNTSRS